MSDWLYPLSKAADRRFVYPGAKRNEDTSVESFRRMMKSPVTDDWWYLSTAYRKVSIDDRIWCYYGRADGDIGIVGTATIIGLRPNRAGKMDIHLKWDKTATKKLLANPVPAAAVRKFIQRPRAAVTGMDNFPALVRKLRLAAGVKN